MRHRFGAEPDGRSKLVLFMKVSWFEGAREKYRYISAGYSETSEWKMFHMAERKQQVDRIVKIQTSVSVLLQCCLLEHESFPLRNLEYDASESRWYYHILRQVSELF